MNDDGGLGALIFIAALAGIGWLGWSLATGPDSRADLVRVEAIPSRPVELLGSFEGADDALYCPLFVGRLDERARSRDGPFLADRHTCLLTEGLVSRLPTFRMRLAASGGAGSLRGAVGR